MITARHLAQSIKELIREGKSEEKVLSLFVKFVEEHHMEAMLPQVVHYLEIFKKEDEAKNECVIEVAHEKVEQEIPTIAEKLGIPEGTTIRAKVNPELIAGFKSSFKGVMKDASLKSQLERLQKHIATN